jgi:hypothetical protein
MGVRWYDSALGRWTSPDSIVPEPNEPQSLNRFSFVLGNPVRHLDPSGHFEVDVVAEYLGCKDQECLEWIANSDWYSTWYWILRAAEDGYYIDIEDWTGTVYGGQVFLEEGELKFTGSLAEGLEKTCFGFGELPITHNSSTFTLTHAEPAAPVHLHTWTSEEEFRQIATGGAYSRQKLDLGRVDWVGAALDVGGILADVFTIGIAGRLTNGAKLAKGGKSVGQAFAALDVAWGGQATARAVVSGEISGDDLAGFGADVFGLYIPIVPDLVSLYLNFNQAQATLP